jgi:gamma-glutamylcyclotransferase (GGCT)/AIG2-like uncharacterized protein YtfP
VKKKILEPVSLYFAYGSNLNVEAMKARCPKAEPYRKLYINNGQLVFRGVADVEGVEEADSMVPGGLWHVTAECIEELDAYEGVSRGLYSKRYLTLLVKGQRRSCLYYKMNSVGVMPPWESYLDVIEQGYRDFKLDRRFLNEAVERAWGEKDKTPDLRRRWLAKGRPRLAQLPEETE